MMKKLGIWTLLIILVLVIAGIGAYKIMTKPNGTMNKSNKLQVITSFYPLYYFASQIGGDKVEVYNITPPGAEPHEYEPTAQDIVQIEKSRLLIINGGQLEPWADGIKKDLEDKQITVITAGEGLADQTMDEDGTRIQDPHVWLSPPRAKQEAETIAKGLIEADPRNTAYYQSNAQELTKKMIELHNQYMQGLNQCVQKDIITSHNAFGYLGETYGLRQVSISGLSTEEEPSAKQLAEVADFAKQNNVKYIFFESLVSPKLSETLAQEVGAQTLVLDPIEGVSDQDMTAGKNYFTIMQDNLTNLRTALECQ